MGYSVKLSMETLLLFNLKVPKMNNTHDTIPMFTVWSRAFNPQCTSAARVKILYTSSSVCFCNCSHV